MNTLSKSILVVCLLCISSAAGRARAFVPDWTRQVGTVADDVPWFEAGNTVSVDGLGFVYFAGQTDSSLAAPNSGVTDTFLAKYDSAGNPIWSRQFGTPGFENTHGLDVDNFGGVFVGGWTQGSLGGPNAGQTDAFVRRYDPAGNVVWTRQVGTAADDRVYGVAADGFGNVYMGGWTSGSLAGPLVGSMNSFLFKFGPTGNQLWARQTNFAASVIGHSVASDSAGNAYLAGTTFGNAFVSKYDASGNFLWNVQLATAQYEIADVLAIDATGNVYVSGETYGNLGGPNAGNIDTFLAKYNSAGVLQWVSQFGTPVNEYGHGLAIDAQQNAILTGTTYASLFGPHAGGGDLYLAKFDPAGILLDSIQLGTPAEEFNSNIAIDPSGAIYVSGGTRGNFGGSWAGGYDVYLARFNIPEPTSLFLLGIGLAGVAMRRPSRRKTLSTDAMNLS